MAKDDIDNEIMKWAIEQVIKIHTGNGMTVNALTKEAKQLYDFVTTGDKEEK